MAKTFMKTDDLIIDRGTEIDLEEIELDTLKEAASGVEEVSFSFDGGHYVIDLNSKNREKFAALLKPFIDAAGNVAAEKPAARGAAKADVEDPEKAAATEEGRRTRAWAHTPEGQKAFKAAGVKLPNPVQGRVSEEARQVYRDSASA